MAKFDWEAGLPSAADLTPLSQSLIPDDLAHAFKIPSEPPRTWLDVNRASHDTFSSLNFLQSSDDSDPPEEEEEEVVVCGSDSKKSRRMEDGETIESCQEEKPAKKARLVWTPQLHKRFVEVVVHLGLKNAVPKTIMHLMNVEGLSRENVASHLQKYRLYISRTQGSSADEGPSQSNQLFSAIPLVQGSTENEKYSRSKGRNESNVATENTNSLHHHHHHYHHYQQQQQYGNMEQEQKSWSGNKYSTTTYSHQLTHNNK